MNIAIQIAAYIFLLTVSGISLAFLISVAKVGRDHWKEAGELSGSAKKVILGEVDADRDGISDPRVVKGKVWDKATKHWKPQGKISDEYLKNLVS